MRLATQARWWISLCLGLLRVGNAEESNTSMGGAYVSVERMDMRRLMMRIARGAPLPVLDDEVMLDELEQWKWRVEMAAAGAAVLVTSSQCPHGLGLLPSTLEQWKWRVEMAAAGAAVLV